MATNRTTLTPALVQADVADLIVATIIEEALAASVATVFRTDRKALTFPLITSDVTATWVAEAAAITPSDIVTGEITIAPAKIVAPSRVSNEALEDTDPALDAILGQSMARDIARKVDAAVFGNVPGGVAPAGLGSLTGATAGGTVTIAATGATAGSFANLDGFVAAIYAARSVGANPTSIVVSPATAKALALTKTASGAASYLLAGTPQDPAALAISGVPVAVSRYCADTAAYVVDKTRLAFVVRKQAQMVVDTSVFALTRETLILQEARVGFGVLQPASVVKITVAVA